jgi:TIR domain
MPDCFISYSSVDNTLAQFVNQELTRQGLNVFMASMSLNAGDNWSDVILENFKASSWVIFLASREACKSAYVLQETGMAVILGKKLVPIIWDINPSELPGWVNRHQALNLRDATFPLIQTRISEIARKIHEDKRNGLLIAGVTFLGLLWLGTRD